MLSPETANANPSTRGRRSATTALPASNGEAPALGLDPRGGSGPAQLALAILAEHLGDDHAALNLYQDFKWVCIAQIRGANWSLSRWGSGTGKWAEKDMDVALGIAQHAKVPMPLAGLVDQLAKSINQDKMKALLA